MEKENHFDVLIIGAGISGIDAAYHIQKNCDWVRKKWYLYFHFQILHKKPVVFSTNLVCFDVTSYFQVSIKQNRLS